MSVIEKLRIFLANLAHGTLFAVQSIIHLGSRTAIDSALYDIHQSKLIQRAAIGVYASTPEGERYKFDPLEIAEIKAQAFNKKIFPHGEDIVRLLKFPMLDTEPTSKTPSQTGENRQVEHTDSTPQSAKAPKEKQNEIGTSKVKVIKLFTTGCTSSFKCNDRSVQVKFISLSKKKLRNYLLDGGYWVNAVRTMGRQYFETHIDELKQKLPPFRTTLESLKDSFVLMPIWLYSSLNIKYGNRYNQRKHPLIDIPQRIPPVPKEHLSQIW
jgi:hypothetical protein